MMIMTMIMAMIFFSVKMLSIHGTDKNKKDDVVFVKKPLSISVTDLDGRIKKATLYF